MGNDEMAALRSEITLLLAAAAGSEIDHAEATKLAGAGHQAEVDQLVASSQRLAAVHLRQDEARNQAHHDAVENLNRALKSRDLIGQAKGVLIVSMRCTDEQAFAILAKQSQHENVKVSEIAREVVERALARAVPPPD